MSGVMVATMIKSISSAVTPAIFIARSAALAAMSEVNSSFARRCGRSLMPVRVVIHSSEVSTIFSRSALVRNFFRHIRADAGDGTGAALKIIFGARIFEFGLMQEQETGICRRRAIFHSRRDFAGDDLVDLVLQRPRRSRGWRWPRRVRAPSVRLENHAVEAEQRRAAINFRIHARRMV
jgi:hypothetical protein